jgi:hypothetical protein
MDQTQLRNGGNGLEPQAKSRIRKDLNILLNPLLLLHLHPFFKGNGQKAIHS